MKRIKAYAGYTMAVLSMLIVLATFLGESCLAKAFAAVTDLKISPWYTGGDVARKIAHPDYETSIHQPVFMALIGERKEGFVQVDWAPLSRLPAELSEVIDYSGDGTEGFRVRIDNRTKKAAVEPLSNNVIGLQGSYWLKDKVVVRVSLKNPKK